MTDVGIKLLIAGDAQTAEQALNKIYTSVQSLAKNIQSVFNDIGGIVSNVSGMFKPISDGAMNATKTALNASKVRIQQDKEETQSALNASKTRLAAIAEEVAVTKQIAAESATAAAEQVNASKATIAATNEQITASKAQQAATNAEIAALRLKTAEERSAAAAKRAEKDLYGQLVAESNELVREYYNAAAAILKYGDASGVTEKRLAELRSTALKSQEQLKSIEAGAGRFQRNVGNYSGATLYLNQTISQLAGEIPNFFQSLKIGFMSISNNIQPIIFALEALKKENADLAAQGLATKSAFTAVTKSLFGWQTLLFVGVGLVSAYGGKLVDMITGADQAKEKAKELKQHQDELNNAFESGASSASKQIVEIQSLAAEMTNSNTPLGKKIDLYNQIIAQYPQLDTGTGTWAEKISNLAGVINTELIPALRKQAIMQGYAAEAAKLGQQLAAKSAESAGLLAKRDAQRFLITHSSNPSLSALRDASAAEKAYSENESAVKDLNRELDAMIENQVKVSQELDKTILSHQTYKQQLQNTVKAEQARLDVLKAGTPEFEKQFDVLQKAKNALKAYDPPLKDAKTHLDALTKSQNNFNAEFAQTDAKLKAGVIDSFEAMKERISAVSQHLDKLFKNGGTQDAIQKDIDLLRTMNYELSAMAKIDLNSAKGFQFGGSAEKEFHQMITYMDQVRDKASKLYNELGIQDPKDSIKRRDIYSQFDTLGIDASKYIDPSKSAKEQAKQGKKALDDLQDSFSKFAARTGRMVGRAIDPLTDAILNGKNAMDALGESVKSMLADLIKAVAKAAILSALGNKDQVSSVGGFGGILGGLLGLGLKGIPFLADGGVVTKPTLAMIGEAGPEAVQPLSKLNNYSGPQQLTLRTKWRGRDIEGATDRYNSLKDY